MRGSLLQITIVIIVYNGEGRIQKVINSILAQAARAHRVKEVLIVSDGSTDRTCEIVRSYPYENIRLVEHRDRKGKAVRLNDVFNTFIDDVLILMDDDMYLVNEFSLHDLLSPFRTTMNSGLVLGQPITNQPTTWLAKIERIIQRWRDWINAKFMQRHDLKSGHQCMLALEESFTRSLNIPAEVADTAAYIYAQAIITGSRVRFSKKGIHSQAK